MTSNTGRTVTSSFNLCMKGSEPKERLGSAIANIRVGGMSGKRRYTIITASGGSRRVNSSALLGQASIVHLFLK
jgi:hypothetical protein